MAKAEFAVRLFREQNFDFAMDAITLRELCPSLSELQCELVVANLAPTPRLMLMSSTSFLLLMVTLADAGAEVLLLFPVLFAVTC